MPEPNPHEFRNALGQFATGVTIVTTTDDKAMPVGVTASSFNSVSLDPPLVLWSLAKTAHSMPAYQNSGGFNVHVLASHQSDLSLNMRLCFDVKHISNMKAVTILFS